MEGYKPRIADQLLADLLDASRLANRAFRYLFVRRWFQARPTDA